MTAEERAKYLVDKMKHWQHKSQDINYSIEQIDESALLYAKNCAIICVDEIIEQVKEYDETAIDGYGYWEQVKMEIKKL